MFRSKASRRLATAAFLILFVVWAGIAVSAVQYLRQQKEEANRTEPFVDAIFAKRDVEARIRVEEDDLEVRSVPESQRHPDAASSMAEVVGKVAEQTIFGGEAVLRAKLSYDGELVGLAFQIDPDHRAVAVSFDEVIGAGGLILPGDSVDVIAVFDDEVRETKEAGFVLQDVLVLAVAKQVQSEQTLPTPAAEAELGGGLTGAGRAATSTAARSVTLAVTPAEAQRLVLAERFGTLKLVLRPVQPSPALPPPQISIDGVFLSEAGLEPVSSISRPASGEPAAQ